MPLFHTVVFAAGLAMAEAPISLFGVAVGAPATHLRSCRLAPDDLCADLRPGQSTAIGDARKYDMRVPIDQRPPYLLGDSFEVSIQDGLVRSVSLAVRASAKNNAVILQRLNAKFGKPSRIDDKGLRHVWDFKNGRVLFRHDVAGMPLGWIVALDAKEAARVRATENEPPPAPRKKLEL